MKVYLANLKKAKMKKRSANEGGAPKLKKAISKRPRVALEGPSILSRAPTAHPPNTLTIEEDDNKVKVILALTPTILIYFSVPTLMVIVPRQLSTSV